MVIPTHARAYVKWDWLRFAARHGWAGVDLFFVLSGFLIGSQLLADAASHGRVDARRFYLKRAWRILPPYFVVLLLYNVWPEFREAPNLDPAWHFILFIMNFGRQGEAFSHAWSLCVEEHFYLILPLIVAASTWRPAWFQPRKVAAIFIVVLGGGLILRLALLASGAPFYPAIYRPTFTHLDGLTVGVGLAVLRTYRWAQLEKFCRRPWLLNLSGMAIIAFGLWLYSGSIPVVGQVFGFFLVAFGFGLAVAAAIAPHAWLARHKIPGAGSVATLAYAIYLTHKQMLHLAHSLVDEPLSHQGTVFAVGMTLIVTAALILHFGVERPSLACRRKILSRLANREAMTTSPTAGTAIHGS